MTCSIGIFSFDVGESMRLNEAEARDRHNKSEYDTDQVNRNRKIRKRGLLFSIEWLPTAIGLIACSNYFV